MDSAGEQTTPITIPEGYLEDFISGVPVRATPEEQDAVQVFARRLVEDLSYSRRQIQTRPQFRVRNRPSDSPPSYPVDIAVFSGEARDPEDLLIVVECKKKKPTGGPSATRNLPHHESRASRGLVQR